ncbi:peptide chain release factor 2 [Ferrovibrio terrae]|uniref:Peptide chain release factor 2 n=1 Tax=Ferrovibrio terrae TaxID=2594003 RepID=A0A516H3D8_9PROT|nr:peptide chain release factor 2 [Ferrovibrio terrae]QDO98287.1 peptide chain release factor 2 [Ferrovibrio terrae]
MRAEIKAMSEEIQQSLGLLRRSFDWDNAVKKLEELNARSEDPTLWNKPAEAQALMRERTRLDRAVGTQRRLEAALNDSLELIEMGDAEGDQSVVDEAEAVIMGLSKEVAQARLESLLSGEADMNDCFVEVHAGAGGTESQDWASMLLRMYVRWAEQHGYKVEFQEESEGEEAGIKSATIKVSGPNAYGWLKNESGVHRLVRISPYDSNARRHTSFSSVGAFPVVDDTIEIEILDKDLRVDTYRASGAGGQHVNKTDSAVRITHIPTGIAVACQINKSQHRNRDEAMKMLKARLYERELQKREAEAQALNDAKTDIGWGHQIRSYVLHPYQMVKDLRTELETSDTQGVLDGDLDAFMAAQLASKVGKGETD